MDQQLIEKIRDRYLMSLALKQKSVKREYPADAHLQEYRA